MSMKPRSIWEKNTTADIAKPVGDCVNQPVSVDEFGNIPGTVTDLKFIPGSHAIDQVVAKMFETGDK